MLVQVGTKVEGNTKTSPTRIRSRRWCLTLNNYTEDELVQIVSYAKTNTKFFIIGKEGDEKTPHLQIYFEFKSPKDFKIIKNINNRLHIEKARGSREDNISYCSKENNFIKTETTIDELKNECLEEYKDINWYPWQQEIIDLVNTKPNNRTINWYWESTGNKGKSFLSRYLFIKYNAILADGKKNDVYNQIKTNIDNKIKPRIVILDIPRHNIDFINYGMLEKIKDGCIYSGKYEGLAIAFPSPHLIVFANSEPEREKYSLDRWNIVNINDSGLDIDSVLRDNL